ncbi:PBECR4 domain-containing protein [Exiguobacterium chiriqhucha]|uniref:PBECR4 domain-containing protein n=1 Tax=Exiguobacterium chiriqhucha TaxID=1385984 RepID=UPI0038BD9E14
MALTPEQLFSLEHTPKINDLTLNLLKEYYEYYLLNESYEYTYEDEYNVAHTIRLAFKVENFCHLLGIESIVKHIIKDRELSEYKGLKGWENICNGTLTFKNLRATHLKKRFKDKKNKFIFFFLIPHLLKNPKAVSFRNVKVTGSGTRIDCEILFYSEYFAAYIHLGIKKDVEQNCYFPMSFFVEKITPSKAGDKFILNQDELIINAVTAPLSMEEVAATKELNE